MPPPAAVVSSTLANIWRMRYPGTALETPVHLLHRLCGIYTAGAVDQTAHPQFTGASAPLCAAQLHPEASLVPSLWPRYKKKEEKELLQLSGHFKEKGGWKRGEDYCHSATSAPGTSHIIPATRGAESLNAEHENKSCSDMLRCLIACLVKMCSLWLPSNPCIV